MSELMPDAYDAEVAHDPLTLARQMCMDRGSDLIELTRVLEQVPELPERLLRRANSPFFRPNHPIRDLQRAVSLLGRQEVLNQIQSFRP